MEQEAAHPEDPQVPIEAVALQVAMAWKAMREADLTEEFVHRSAEVGRLMAQLERVARRDTRNVPTVQATEVRILWMILDGGKPQQLCRTLEAAERDVASRRANGLEQEKLIIQSWLVL